MSTDPRPFRLGEWWIEPLTGEIRRHDETLRLEPRVMQVLVYLAHNSSRVVPTQELLDGLWTGGKAGEHVLWRCIAALRRALGDDLKRPKYIRTLPRQGYCLVAEIGPTPEDESLPAEPPAAFPRAEPVSEKPAVPGSGVATPRRLRFMAAGAALTVLTFWASSPLWRSLAAPQAVEAPVGRAIVLEAMIDAPLDQTFNAWRHPRGVLAIFGVDQWIETRSEESVRLTFALPAVDPPGPVGGGDLDTRAEILFEAVPGTAARTRLRVTHDGFGHGQPWDKAYRRALEQWGEVLTRLGRAAAP